MAGFDEGNHPRDDHGRFSAGEHAKAAEKSYAKAQGFVAKARAARDTGDQAGFAKHMATATKHIQAGDASQSKAKAGGMTGLQGFVYKHGGEGTKAPAAPAPKAEAKSGLAAFTEKHADAAPSKPEATPRDGNHPELHKAIDEVNKSTRAAGMPEVSHITKNLMGKGWSREEVHGALLDARSKGKVDLKVANNPRHSSGHSTGANKGIAPADDPDVIREKDPRSMSTGINTVQHLAYVVKR